MVCYAATQLATQSASNSITSYLGAHATEMEGGVGAKYRIVLICLSRGLCLSLCPPSPCLSLPPALSLARAPLSLSLSRDQSRANTTLLSSISIMFCLSLTHTHIHTLLYLSNTHICSAERQRRITLGVRVRSVFSKITNSFCLCGYGVCLCVHAMCVCVHARVSLSTCVFSSCVCVCLSLSFSLSFLFLFLTLTLCL